MKNYTRRVAIALTLTIALATSPAAIAAPGRGSDREGISIVQVIKRIALRIIGITSTLPTGPIPAPDTNNNG